MFIEKHIKIYHPNEDEKSIKILRALLKGFISIIYKFIIC